MKGSRRILTVVWAITVAMLVISAGFIAYAITAKNSFSGFTFQQYSEASNSTGQFFPTGGYSLNITAKDCKITILQSQDESLSATLDVSNSFFRTAFAIINVSSDANDFSFDFITPDWFGTDASANVYIPTSLNATSISASTSNGGISMGASGITISFISMATTNGNLEMGTGPSQSASLPTTNGNIALSAGSFSSISASTENGNVEAHFASQITSGSVTISTTNGNVNFDAPSTSNLTLSASTVNGAVDISGFTYSATQFTDRQFVGVINLGGATINLSTVNGNIKITGL